MFVVIWDDLQILNKYSLYDILLSLCIIIITPAECASKSVPESSSGNGDFRGNEARLDDESNRNHCFHCYYLSVKLLLNS